MLAVSGVPNFISGWVTASELGLWGLLFAYLGILLLLGTIMDSSSIMLIVVPLFLPAFLALETDLIWLGVLTVLVTEIGLLTPPFGMAVFVVKSTLDDKSITLNDIFMGSLPFALIMAAVALLVALFPQLVTAFI
jgi:TRAP-type C4-dicarboxylate transport system permease large subunit